MYIFFFAYQVVEVLHFKHVLKDSGCVEVIFVLAVWAKFVNQIVDDFSLFLLDFKGQIGIFKVMDHDVQELIKKFTYGFLVNMVDQAIDKVWVLLEHVRDNLFLFPIDEEGHKLREVSCKNRV